MVDIEIYKAFGQIAGIGGLALAVFLIIFRDIIKKNIFTKLNQRQSYTIFLLLIILTSLITLSGIASWLYAKVFYKPPPPEVKAVVSGVVQDENENLIRNAHIIFEPLGVDTRSKADGSFSKIIALPNLPFPVTISVIHSEYYSYESSFIITHETEHIVIQLDKL